MTPTERAKKMWSEMPRNFSAESWISYMTAQIEEAEREAVENRINWEYGREAKDRVMRKSYAEGFLAARKRAAWIVYDSGATPNPIDLAQRIREMEI